MGEELLIVDDKRENAGRDTNDMPQLIMLDLHMPWMDGFETLRRIRADERTELLPVVMFSASNSPEDITKAHRLGPMPSLTRWHSPCPSRNW